ncbi:MAG: hypothetical protein ABL877_10505 [Thiobacillus sp.]
MNTLFSVGLMVVVMATPAWAANDSREKQMLRRVQQQMQQVEQARAQAEQEKATALADKDKIERDLEQAQAAGRKLSGERAARSRAERELKAAQGEAQALKTKLAEMEAKLVETQTKLQATSQTLTQKESAKKQTESQLAGVKQEQQECRKQNHQFYELTRETMTRYRDKTCQDALAQAEPFTGIKKVEMENLLETWRDRADQARLQAKQP